MSNLRHLSSGDSKHKELRNLHGIGLKGDRWKEFSDGKESVKEFFTFTEREPQDGPIIIILTVIMVAIVLFSKFTKNFRTPERSLSYAVLHEHEGKTFAPDPHRNCTEHDDPPMQMGEEYRLCKL